MLSGVPSYSSPFRRGGIAVLSGDGQSLHLQRDQHSWTHQTPVMNKRTLIASDAEALLPDSSGVGYSLPREESKKEANHSPCSVASPPTSSLP